MMVVTVIVRVLMRVIVRVTVAMIVMMAGFAVGVLHSRRHRDLRHWLRIEPSPEQQHQQRAAKRE